MPRTAGSKNKTYHWMVVKANGNKHLYRTCKDVQLALGLSRDRVLYLAKKQHKHTQHKKRKTQQALRAFRILRVHVS